MSEIDRSDDFTDGSPLADDFNTAEEAALVHPEVLEEIERLRNKKTSWKSGLAMLGISLVLFVGAAQMGWGWETMLSLVVILFVHEMGHLVAMRIFNYRNTRMFFIPFFGAAVTGQHDNVDGWKKCVVSLMGPLPGIFMGAALGALGLLLEQSWLIEASFLALIVNGFNLLPVLPFDGGWVMHATLFSRHRFLDVTFRLLAVVALLGLAAMFQDWILLAIAFFVGVGVVPAYRAARIADSLRREGYVPPETDHAEMPWALADSIAGEVKAASPSPMLDRVAAQWVLNIYQSINARPPSWWATLLIWGIHGGSIAVAIVAAALIAVGKQDLIAEELNAVRNQPLPSYVQCDGSEWQGSATRAL